jgi:hypothetical protein
MNFSYLSDIFLLVRREKRRHGNWSGKLLGQNSNFSRHQARVLVAAVLAERLEIKV